MYLKLIFFVGVIGAAGAAYAYHEVTVAKLEKLIIQLHANNKTLKDNNVTLEETAAHNATKVTELEEHGKAQRVQVTGLISSVTALKEEKSNFLRIFKDHNLTRLARAKPAMIETRANKKTLDIFRQIEEDSREVENADN